MQCCVLGSSNLPKRKNSDHYIGMGNNVASWMGRGADAGLSSEESENEMQPLFPVAKPNQGSDSAMAYNRNVMHEHPAARSDADSTMASSTENENARMQRDAPELQREETSTLKDAYKWYQREAGYLASSLLAFVGLSILAIIGTYKLLDESFCFAIRAVHAIFKFCLPVTPSWNCHVKYLRTKKPNTGMHDGESETSTVRNGLDSAVAENECENLEDVRTDENNRPEQVQVAKEASSGNQRQTEPPVGEVMPSTSTFSENKVVNEHLGAIPVSREFALTTEAEDACSSKSSTYWSSLTSPPNRDDNASPDVACVATEKKVAAAHYGARPQLDPTELSQIICHRPNDSACLQVLEKPQLNSPLADLQNLGLWGIPTVAMSILVGNFASVIYFFYIQDIIILMNLVNDVLSVHYPWIKRKLATKLVFLRDKVSKYWSWLADRILWAESKLLTFGDEPPFHVSQHLVVVDLFLSLLCVVFSRQNPVSLAINVINLCYKFAMLVYHFFPHEEYKKVATEYCRLNYWLVFKIKVRVIWKNLLETRSPIHWADLKSRITYPFRKVRQYVLVPTDRERNLPAPV